MHATPMAIAILAVIAAAILMLASAPSLYSLMSSKQPLGPNIIIIMTDDLDVNSMNALLEMGWMPTLQSSIIDRGVTFTQAYSTTPLCCPSRATFLTGQYAHNHGVLANLGAYGGADALKDNATIAVSLNEMGYRTGYVGKYLNSYGSETEKTYIPPGWDDWQATTIPSSYRMYNYTVNDNGQLMHPHNWYQTDNLARRASEFIIESGSNPFFLYVGTLTPHSELQGESCGIQEKTIGLIRAPPKYEGSADSVTFQPGPAFNEDVSDKPPPFRDSPQIDELTGIDDEAVKVALEENRVVQESPLSCLERFYKDRLEAMRGVDDLLARIISTLENRDLLESTLLIFTSDNGFMLGEHRFVGKFYPYEEAARIPLYIAGPAVHERTNSKLVLTNDIAPTIMDIVGGHDKIDSMDGRSLAPFLYGGALSEWRTAFLIEAYFEEKNTPAYTAIHTENWVYIERYDDWREYYDLETDPYQLQNRYDEYDAQALKERLELFKGCRGDSCRAAENGLPNSIEE